MLKGATEAYGANGLLSQYLFDCQRIVVLRSSVYRRLHCVRLTFCVALRADECGELII